MLSYVAGQTAIGLPVAQVPLWFNEGDAIIAETIFGSGRGNLPTFEMPFKAYLLESDKRISYDKSYFGSFKDFVPDYYRLGYFMVGYSRIRYGRNIWNLALHRVGNLPALPFALNHYLNSQYAVSMREMYDKTLDTLKMIWTNDYKQIKLTPFIPVSVPSSKFYSSYRYPHILYDKSIVLYKTSMDDLDKIVRIDTKGVESVIFIPGYVIDGRLSCASNKVVWDEIVADVRWEQRNFSVIKSIDLSTGITKTLTNNTRYFSPCVSSDGNRIAVVEIDVRNDSWLVILNATTGNVMERIKSPENGLITFPYWINTQELIMIFTTADKGKTIYKYSQNQKKWTRLIQPTFNNISQLSAWRNFVIYTAGYSGTDNIYALNTTDGKIFQVTSSGFGAFDPFVTPEDTLYYSEYTHNGYIPVKLKLNSEKWTMYKNVQNVNSSWTKKLTDQEGVRGNSLVFKDTTYLSKPYSRILHLINIHSWAPFYVDPQVTSIAEVSIKPGLILLSQNKLSTAISSFGLTYENNSLILKPAFTYTGFYPVLDFSATFGGPNSRHILPDGVIPKDSVYPNINFTLRSYVPLRIYRNKYFKLAIPEIDMEYRNTLFYNNSLRKGITFIHYKLLLYRYLILSQQDIYPKWGELINFAFTHTPFEHSQYGKLLSTAVKLYAPGFYKHHSLGISCGIQYQDTRNRLYYYSFNRIGLPRGYSSVLDAYVAEFITKFTIDYNFSLIYPDLSFGPIIYIKRIRVNIFTDYAYGYHAREYTGNSRTLRTGNYLSYGIGIVSDLHLFRFYFPFSLGTRISYLPFYNLYHPELIFAVNTGIF